MKCLPEQGANAFVLFFKNKIHMRWIYQYKEIKIEDYDPKLSIWHHMWPFLAEMIQREVL